MDKDMKIDEMQYVKDYTGKTIISINEGKNLGTLQDVLIDPDPMEIAALVTSHGWLPWHDLKAIPASNVQVWGEDVILVEAVNGIKKEKELPGTETWLSVSDDIIGRDVISLDGDKVGQIGEVLMDSAGELIGFQFSQIGYALDTVLAEGPGPKPDWIPGKAVHSMGQDVLVIYTEKIKTEG